ncbi:MAG: transposase [Runella sp.]
MAGIIKEKNQKPIIVNGVSDHVHVFLGIKPTMNISELVRDIKNNSSKFINEQKFIPTQFSWQEGYGAFSYAQSQIKKRLSIHSKSRRTPSQKDISERIFGFSTKI